MSNTSHHLEHERIWEKNKTIIHRTKKKKDNVTHPAWKGVIQGSNGHTYGQGDPNSCQQHLIIEGQAARQP
jgi:hypothetical protein